MKKTALLLILLVTTCLSATAQQKIYDDKADAMKQIDDAIATAQQTGRYVLCQVGGNWCPWCLRFAHFADTNATIHKTIAENFVYTHINWSRENKNPEAMKRLKNPARFGFPVFVILDDKGEVIHIQNSSYLEEGKGYNVKTVNEFLLNWTPAAVGGEIK